VRLLNLKLKNFKGIRNFNLDTGGENISVLGDNATGKTTLFDAFCWLLFDKDSLNRKDFDIKTLDENNQPLHGLNHEVEGLLGLDDKQLVLRKVYSEQWTKKRGSAQATFTGHTIDHFIDSVPAQKKEYDTRIADIVNENIFKLLTNPRYFNDMLHWQKRREILLEVCGDVRDQDVIASDKALAGLPEILGGRKLEDHRKIIAAKRSEINKELERIPVRIDEVGQGLPEMAVLDATKIADEINSLKTRKNELEQQKVRLESGGEVAEKQKALREIEAELLSLKTQLRAGITEQADAERARRNQLANEMTGVDSAIRSKKHIICDNRMEIERLENRMDRLRIEWNQENEKVFEFEQSDTCPTCGQALPADQLEAAREKALADFNQAKAQRLEDISSQGKDARVRAGELALQNAELEKQIQTAEKQLEGLRQEDDRVRARIDELKVKADDVVNAPAYLGKAEGKAILEAAITELKAGNADSLAKLEQDIKDLESRLDDLGNQKTRLESRKNGMMRIEQLKVQERELAAEYERLEQELYLCEQFVCNKVKLLERKINSRFKHARFKLFDIQVNGGVVECCETLYQGVPYSSALNNAARINVGLDIINTLSEHYNFQAPIFIDNKEAVTRLIPTRGQLISLIVSEPDKNLRVEHVVPTKTPQKEAV
jgi:DNA repair exonuclease SbcCD ATPase subunit